MGFIFSEFCPYESENDIIRKSIRATKSFLSVQSFKNKIDKIFMKKDRGTFCVKMCNGEEIRVHLQKGDTWDTEKALLLCYIKWVNGNDSKFNEIFDLLDRVEDTTKNEKAKG